MVIFDCITRWFYVIWKRDPDCGHRDLDSRYVLCEMYLLSFSSSKLEFMLRI